MHHVEIESTIIMKLSARAELNISSHACLPSGDWLFLFHASYIINVEHVHAAGRYIIERAVNAALADIEEYAPQEFKKLQADLAKKQALIQAAREVAEEEVKLAEEFRTRPSENVAEHLSKHLPQHRVELHDQNRT